METFSRFSYIQVLGEVSGLLPLLNGIKPKDSRSSMEVTHHLYSGPLVTIYQYS